MHLYNKNGTIRKYDTIYQIMDEHYYVRLNMYTKRKNYELNILENDSKLLEAKMRFIQNVIDEEIVIYRKSKASIIEKLRELNYPFYENSEISDYDEGVEIKNHYNYLLKLSIDSFTSEKVDELEKIVSNLRVEVARKRDK